jgi:CheY-like chemotaxis protein
MEPTSVKSAQSSKSYFKLFHDLMPNKINRILLICTSYEAWIMEEECRLSEQIVHEYRGLNLSHPPRLTWASSMQEALLLLETNDFDLVITMSREADANAYGIGNEIKRKKPDIPVVLLTHQVAPADACVLDPQWSTAIDRVFFWSGNADILLAIIKCIEDQQNVLNDTARAGIRIILFVEDSPFYLSSLLSILYKELVLENQAVIEEGLNEEHRILSMRARPKILVAQSYEAALDLYEQFKPYVLGVISDVRFPRNCELNARAGLDLLSYIKKDRFDVPLLLASSEPHNADLAAQIPAVFVDKNSPSLHEEVRNFLMDYLGFGVFIFRLPDGRPIGTATDLYSLELKISQIPADSFLFHCNRNDFSRYLFSLAELELAAQVRPLRDDEFDSVESHRRHLLAMIKNRRMQRQKGVVVNFDAQKFEPETEFLKIGKGSFGGKARGLAFISYYLHHNPHIIEKFNTVKIYIPQTLIVTTEGFDEFVKLNDLKNLAKVDLDDEAVAARFLESKLPDWLESNLRAFVKLVNYPIAVRSSSLLEDAQFKAYAGLYKTYMISNDGEDLESRLRQLANAIKLVFASTYYVGPKAFSRRVGQRTEEEKMAVIIQQVVGKKYGRYFYPCIAGVGQSRNYYPFGKMKAEEGIATIALGLGKTVMDGEKALRFSPHYPEILPQHGSVEDILENSQKFFYALKLNSHDVKLHISELATLEKRDIFEAIDEPALINVCSTYYANEHRLRHSLQKNGAPIVTFNHILKNKNFPLPEIIKTVLKLGQEAMGCPVEIEFSINLDVGKDQRPEFAILQIRPMTAREELLNVNITEEDIQNSFCYSENCLGNGVKDGLSDIIYVKRDGFDPGRTPDIAREIGQLNAKLSTENKKYLLIGPGRWGSADRWLGIPVSWNQISHTGAFIELHHDLLKAEPSQGSHFFHNITSLGINYITVKEKNGDFINWNWLTSIPPANETSFVAHIQLDKPFTLKVDGRSSKGVILL